MSDELLSYYNDELFFLRHLGQEFAGQHPRTAGRLRLVDGESRDPHVERLIQAFAYLTARTRHKLDDEFPEISDALLDVLYPHYLRPMPSMSIVEFSLNRGDTGYTVPVHSQIEVGEGEPCRFRTAYPVRLWPIELLAAKLSGFPLAFQAPPAPGLDQVKGVLKLELRCFDADMTFAKLQMDEGLRFYLNGDSAHVYQLYELILNNTLEIAVANRHNDERPVRLSKDALRPVGFEDSEGLLPQDARSHPGYRLLSEFFAFPEKFLFFDLRRLPQALAGIGRTLEVYLYLNCDPGRAQSQVSKETFRLGCTPIVNLFQRSAEPILLTQTGSEQRVIVDASRKQAYEVYSIERVSTLSERGNLVYEPFFSTKHATDPEAPAAYWHAVRKPAPGDEQNADGATAVYLQLVDLDFGRVQMPDATLNVEILCINRDLPPGDRKLQLIGGGPLELNCLKEFTPPRRLAMGRGAAWRLLSHLSLNHLSLVNIGETADALREMLKLYDYRDSDGSRGMINGLLSVETSPAVARVTSGRLGMCRGLDVHVDFDEDAFTGSGVYLFASVLERFLGLWCSINSFTRLTATTGQPGKTYRWPPRAGEKILC